MMQVQSGSAVKGSDNVDIGCGNAFGGDEEAVDDSVEKVLELHTLQLFTFRVVFDFSTLLRV